MDRFDYGGDPPKRGNPHRGQVGRASDNPAKGTADSQDHSTLQFSSGNAGSIQRKIIRHLLAMVDGGFDRLPDLDRLDKAGTDAIRTVCAPHKNPMEYISQLRALNGAGCLLSMPVEAARIGAHGSAPIYYWLPLSIRQGWREALRNHQEVAQP